MKKIDIKYIIIILVIILVTGCSSKNNAVITVKNTNFEFSSDIYLSDIISIENGNILDNNLLDYNKSGKQTISINYQDDKKHKGIYDIEIEIVDKVNPVLSISKNIYSIKDNDVDLCGRAFYADDSDTELDCKIDGDYDISVVGKYPLKITITDDYGNYTSKDINLYVVDELEESDVEVVDDELSDMINKLGVDNYYFGIDVSSYQGEIDWNKVKDAGITFAFIRLGFGHTSENTLAVDNYFYQNIENAKDAGIDVGVYFYSYATSMDEVIEQANFVVNKLNGIDLDLPVAFDFESWKHFSEYKINLFELNKLVDKFSSIISNNGYDVVNYGSKYYLNNAWIYTNVDTWLAHYTYNTDYDKDYKIWQFTDTGIVDGIDGYVDLDVIKK